VLFTSDIGIALRAIDFFKLPGSYHKPVTLKLPSFLAVIYLQKQVKYPMSIRSNKFFVFEHTTPDK
jgi:hypothetical protein